MKKIYFLLFVIFLTSFFCNVFAQKKSFDSTFSDNLIGKKLSEIRIIFEYDEKEKFFNGNYTIDVDGMKQTDYIEDLSGYFEIKTIDVDKKDMYREIIIAATIEVEWTYKIFRYTGDKLLDLGELYSAGKIDITGDGKIKTDGWMGFWTYDNDYIFNKENNKFEIVGRFEYDVKFYEGFDGEITVKKKFKTYKERDIKSPVITNFKIGDKIKILKAYTKYENCSEDYEDYCFWYLIEDKNGKRGWLQLKDFWQKVDGIPWAG
jgi:hypothetical protein